MPPILLRENHENGLYCTVYLCACPSRHVEKKCFTHDIAWRGSDDMPHFQEMNILFFIHIDKVTLSFTLSLADSQADFRYAYMPFVYLFWQSFRYLMV